MSEILVILSPTSVVSVLAPEIGPIVHLFLARTFLSSRSKRHRQGAADNCVATERNFVTRATTPLFQLYFKISHIAE